MFPDVCFGGIPPAVGGGLANGRSRAREREQN